MAWPLPWDVYFPGPPLTGEETASGIPEEVGERQDPADRASTGSPSVGRERMTVGLVFEGDPCPAPLQHSGNRAPGCDKMHAICEAQSSRAPQIQGIMGDSSSFAHTDGEKGGCPVMITF